MSRLRIAALCAAIVALPAFGQEQAASALFSTHTRASPHAAQAIGGYSKGCAAGLVQLPQSGPSWQAMRLSRNRHWGHPDTISFVTDLSETAQNLGWAGLYIGDMSQPRGGPIHASEHSSHQIGLDVDIWHLPPKRLDLTEQERETISSIPMRSADQKSVTPEWSAAHHALLRAAASDARVDRILVAAAIKIEMCKSATAKDTPWLQKIRPIGGHDTHFHVRLKCPKDSPFCQEQAPDVATLSNGGNGCDENLMWWVTTYLEPRPKDNVKPQRKVQDYTMAELPTQCQTIFAAP